MGNHGKAEQSDWLKVSFVKWALKTPETILQNGQILRFTMLICTLRFTQLFSCLTLTGVELLKLAIVMVLVFGWSHKYCNDLIKIYYFTWHLGPDSVWLMCGLVIVWGDSQLVLFDPIKEGRMVPAPCRFSKSKFRIISMHLFMMAVKMLYFLVSGLIDQTKTP